MNQDNFFVRIRVIQMVIAVIAAVIVAQMVRILVTGTELVSPDTRFETIYPERGKIYDRNGNVLAGNRVVYEISVNLNTVNANQNQDQIIQILFNVIGKDYSEKFLSAQAYNASQPDPDKKIYYLVLDDFIDPEKITYLEEYLTEYAEKRLDKKTARKLPAINLNGLEWWPHLVRTYPESTLASNVIGFVAFNDRTSPAYYGIEEEYDDLLKGNVRTIEVSDDPNKMKDLPDIPPGGSLILTIDRQLQKSVENILDNAVRSTGSQSGVVIVEDPRTGEILAMASYPRMDLNNYGDELEKFPEMGSFNRAIGVPYEPGSVFKVITMASALDSGTVTPSTTFNDTGSITIGSSVIRNWNGGAWGMQDMQGCMQHSLNVCLSWIAQKMDVELFYDSLTNFGVGKSTNIDLAGEIIYPLSYPGDTYWSLSNLGTNSFGQGLATTPIQMVAAVSAVANGGKIMTPHLVKATIQDGVTYEYTPQVMLTPISEETAATLTEMLARSLELEASNALIDDYRVAGKTGTGEIAIPGQGYVTELTNASFVGWGPADDPQFLVYVWLEKPTSDRWGSVVASPVFADVVKQVVIYMNIPPDDIRMRLYASE